MKKGDVLEDPKGGLWEVVAEPTPYNNFRATVRNTKEKIHYACSPFGWVYLMEFQLKPFEGAKVLNLTKGN